MLGRRSQAEDPQINDLGDLGGIHLAVLSACETALGGRDSEGLEIAGMSYYFLRNGTKSVLASLWQVNDASTSTLMERFYQQLATRGSGQGVSKTEALRQAQLSLLREPPCDTGGGKLSVAPA